MPLTFPGAELFVERLHEELRAIYPAIPPCINVHDEPSGDFGIAHFWGIIGTGPNETAQLSFDNDRMPARYVVTHELGHALSSGASLYRGGNSFDNGLYDEYWAARGFPGTPMQAQLDAIARENIAPNAGYRYWPEESFADTFGVVNTPYAFPITEQRGIYLDQGLMRSFYLGLRGIELPTQDEINSAVVAALTSFGLDANTFETIKKRLGIDAHHKHDVVTSSGTATDLSTGEPK